MSRQPLRVTSEQTALFKITLPSSTSRRKPRVLDTHQKNAYLDNNKKAEMLKYRNIQFIYLQLMEDIYLLHEEKISSTHMFLNNVLIKIVGLYNQNYDDATLKGL